MIIWDDSMATGVPEIDGQHIELIERYNAFAETLNTHQFMTLEAGELLDFLQFYAVWHFEREEECFDKYECPIAAANKEAHAEFIHKFGYFYEQWQTQGMNPELMRQTFAELGIWIANHIRRIDTELYPCYATHARQ